jgi:hypothetical protein
LWRPIIINTTVKWLTLLKLNINKMIVQNILLFAPGWVCLGHCPKRLNIIKLNIVHIYILAYCHHQQIDVNYNCVNFKSFCIMSNKSLNFFGCMISTWTSINVQLNRLIFTSSVGIFCNYFHELLFL